jgi:hypothetical protein
MGPVRFSLDVATPLKHNEHSPLRTGRRKNKVTDQQLLTLALAIVIPLSMLIYSNSRISEAKETLRAETAKLGAELKGETIKLGAGLSSEMTTLRGDIVAKLDHLEAILKVHELEHHRP